MLSRTFSATTIGLQPIKIEVEVDSNRGQPNLIVIGLPNKAVEEARERITQALINCGIHIRPRRTVVNLAPADLRKTSSSLELAIAVGMLKMYGEIDLDTDKLIFLGELSLDGDLKPIKGALNLVLAAKEMGFRGVVLPQANANEVAIVTGITIFPIKHLQNFIQFALGKEKLVKLKHQQFKPDNNTHSLCLSDIHGQEAGKRALEIAAAGAHNLLLIGPPGAGKSMMAKAMVSILPPLTEQETIEITKVYSVCGLTHQGLIKTRPFRSPHHTTSQVGLIGGGRTLKPGEISLAHRGILFLDEFPEFTRASLEALRQPLEDGNISVSRAAGSATYPANFCLIAAANPCMCGFRGCVDKICSCSDHEWQKYQKKLSGPILDRIDMHLRVGQVKVEELGVRIKDVGCSSLEIRKKIIKARELQAKRFKNTSFITNSDLDSKSVKKYCSLSVKARNLLNQAAKKLGLSARSYFKMIKIARTIADLEGKNQVEENNMAEALGFRRENN
jgi:magnesium chelatase family protein